VLLKVNQPRVASGYYYAAAGGSMMTAGLNDHIFEEYEQADYNHAAKLLRHYRKNMIDKFGEVDIHMILSCGENIGEEIVDYVEKVHADTLILGSRELGAMKR
jgi:nucleotide-binding universal stress UspA family protein